MKRCLSGIILVLLTIGTAVSAQAQKRAMTVDDGLNMIRVSNPRISPDGKWVLFSRSELKWEDNKRESHFWMVPTTGEKPFQFTSGDSDSNPQWSPDSNRIAFLRGKGEAGRQIHVIRLGGGEALKLSDHKDGISSFRWSRNGRQIFFLAKDIKSKEKKKKEKNGDDVIFVDEEADGQTRRGRWNNLWVIDLGEKKERQITKEKLIIRQFEPSPDGKQIAFHARRENTRNGGYLSEIFVADAGTGAVEQLTENKAPEGSLQWAPDGRAISYLAPDDKQWELALAKIWVLDATTKRSRMVSGGFQGNIGRYAWTPGGGQIIFSGQQGTHRNLYQLDIDSGKVDRLTSKQGVLNVSSYSTDCTRAAATYSTPQQPSDVWVWDRESGEERQLTHANPWVGELEMAQTKLVRWKSHDGLEIEGILYLPEDYDAGTRAPLILVVHGGPAGSFTYSFRSLYHVYTGMGFALLCPNVRGSSGYSDALLRGNMHDLGGGDYRDLMSGVDAMVEQGIADPNRLGIKGWSYGGILGGWTITQTKRFKAASLGAMVTDWASEYAMGFNHDVRLWYIGATPWENPKGYHELSSYSHIAAVETPTILFHGVRDTTDTIGQSMMFYQALTDRGVPTRLLRFPREPHGFREPHHQRIRDVEEISWMQKYLNHVEWNSVRPEEKKKQTENGDERKPHGPQHRPIP